MMALDHFDFYYAPLFGRSWPSIRLGLLTPNKFIAVLNRYSQSFDVNERIIRDLGTLDVIERLNSVKKHGSEVQGNLSIHSNGEYLGEVDEGISSAAHEQDPSFEQVTNADQRAQALKVLRVSTYKLAFLVASVSFASLNVSTT